MKTSYPENNYHANDFVVRQSDKDIHYFLPERKADPNKTLRRKVRKAIAAFAIAAVGISSAAALAANQLYNEVKREPNSPIAKVVKTTEKMVNNAENTISGDIKTSGRQEVAVQPGNGIDALIEAHVKGWANCDETQLTNLENTIKKLNPALFANNRQLQPGDRILLPLRVSN